MKKMTLAAIAATALLTLTGCSTTPTEEPTPTVSEAATVDPNAPRGYSFAIAGTPVPGADGSTVLTGTKSGFQYFYGTASPKLALNAENGSYNCTVQDGMTLAAATAFAKGDLTEGSEAFLKEDNGNAFPVTLKDLVTEGEAHRFAEPAQGTGLLLSCFGPAGKSMVDDAWEWIEQNVDVIIVDKAAAGLIAPPVLNSDAEADAPATEPTPTESTTEESTDSGK